MLTQLPAHSSLTSTYPPPQTNYLGPYTLTRLLEKKLAASKARVVTVASITHRTVRIKDAEVGGWGGGGAGWGVGRLQGTHAWSLWRPSSHHLHGAGIRDQGSGMRRWMDRWLAGWVGGWVAGWVGGWLTMVPIMSS